MARHRQVHPLHRGAAALGLLVLLAVSVGGAARAAPPDEGKAPPAEGAEEAAATLPELEETIERSIREAMALEARIRQASGEQQDILMEERDVSWSEAGQALGELIQKILDGEEEIDDGARDRAGAFLDRLAEWNEHSAEVLTAELERLRGERDAAPEEERSALAESLAEVNAEYDQLLFGWMSQIRAREALGLDASAHYAKADQLLVARAEERATQIRVTSRRIDDLREKAATADEEEARHLGAEIASLEDLLDQRVESLQQLADLLDARELPTAEHRELLIEATGEITTDVFSPEVMKLLVARFWASAVQWLAGRAPTLAFKGLVVLVLLFAAHLTGRLTQRVVRRAFEGSKTPVSQLFHDFALNMTYRVVIGLGILIALSQLGVQIGPLLAGLGVASFIIGFALQDTLSNFAAGMLILAYRPFDVGDVIEAGGVTGKVDQMTLVTTTILTFDNQRLIVPNSKIWGDVITNVTAEQMRRVDLTFGIGYSDDVERAEKILLEIVTSHEKVLKEPEPVVKLNELGDSSVNFIVRPWARTVDYWDVSWDVTREVKRRFDAEGISIPFPQRDVHLYPQGDSAT